MSKVLPWVEHAARKVLASKVPASLIISGRAGIGKTALARLLAKSILCENRRLETACDACESCHWFDLGNHPDYRFVTPGALAAQEAADKADASETSDSEAMTKAEQSAAKSQEIRIDQLRGLANFCAVGGHRGGGRVIVIDPAQTMNTEASNTVLKILEEPTPGLHFVLVCERLHGLLPTIASRCQKFSLPAPTENEATQWLSLALNIGPSEALKAIKRAQGSPLHASRLVEPAQLAVYQTSLEAIARLPDTSAVELAAELVSNNLDSALLLDLLQNWLMELERVRAGLAPAMFTDQAARLRSLVKRSTAGKVAKAFLTLGSQRRLVRHPLNPRLFLEENLLSMEAAFSK